MFLSSCGNPSPCKCARAAVNNDTKVKQECDRYTNTLSQSDQLEFNKKIVSCIQGF